VVVKDRNTTNVGGRQAFGPAFLVMRILRDARADETIPLIHKPAQ